MLSLFPILIGPDSHQAKLGRCPGNGDNSVPVPILGVTVVAGWCVRSGRMIVVKSPRRRGEANSSSLLSSDPGHECTPRDPIGSRGCHGGGTIGGMTRVTEPIPTPEIAGGEPVARRVTYGLVAAAAALYLITALGDVLRPVFIAVLLCYAIMPAHLAGAIPPAGDRDADHRRGAHHRFLRDRPDGVRQRFRGLE